MLNHHFYMMVRRRRRRVVKRKRQRGGALARRRPRLVDKIAEGASMVLSGPAPTFATLGAKFSWESFKRHHRQILQTSTSAINDGTARRITRLLL